MKLQEYRVIKKISKEHPFFKQLKKEARFLSEHSSEFLPKLYDVEEDKENLYLIEEYIQGSSLNSHDFLKNQIKESEFISISTELFEFLKFINSLKEPVLYIDWKPGNIILTEKGIKIVDFGSVCYMEDGDDFTGLATKGFAAPELVKGGKIGVYTDIYGFGSIISYLADKTEGRRSFFRKNAKERLIRLAAKCTKQNVSERPDIRAIGTAVQRLKRRHGICIAVKKQIIDNINVSKIGVCGITSGVGTTHVAFCIAKELVQKGRKVAYVALSNEDDMESELKKSSESLKDVQIYSNVYEDDITYFLKKGFDNLIIDFGRTDEFSMLFHSCDKKIVVVQNNFIKGGNLEEFLINHRHDIGNKGWMVVDNLADEVQFSLTKEQLKKLGFGIECKGIGFERI